MGKFISQEEIVTLRNMVAKGEITDREAEDAIIAGTPALWAQTYLCDPDNPGQPFVLRTYQHEVLADFATVALRWGRGSGKSLVLAVRIIWELFTEPNVRLLFFAPAVKHITDIYEYIDKLIKASPELASYILDANEAKKKNKMGKPKDAVPTIMLKNGASIKFFHTQSKKAQESIRGTNGDKFFLDEAHYIEEDTLASIAGIITRSRSPFVWAQSTPRGPVGWFYDFANSADFHSHHTSDEAPDWTELKEKTLRLLLPDEASYQREVKAEWGADGSNAFTPAALDAAELMGRDRSGTVEFQKNMYLSEEQIEAMPGDVYLGVDWNAESAGVKIIKLKRLAGTNRVYYMGVDSIETPTYTQTTAIERIFQLIDKYNPAGIAVDEGYGAYQAETITKKLEDPKYAMLRDKFYVVNSSHVIHIPVNEFFGGEAPNEERIAVLEKDSTKNMDVVKIPSKVFMVSVLTRMMLNGEVAIGHLDNGKERKTFMQELRSVRVEKVHASGYPVYSKKDLHKFAAGILAFYAAFMDMAQYKIVMLDGKRFLRKYVAPAPVPTRFDLFRHTGPMFAPKARSLSAGSLVGAKSVTDGRGGLGPTKQTEELRRREDLRDLGVIVGNKLGVSPRAGGYLSGYTNRGGFRRR